MPGAENSDSFKLSTPSQREIRMTRLFDAAPALVFEAMSSPEHVRRWWGALDEGYSMPVCEMDFRVGGKWRYSSKTPKGQLVTFYGEYREIKPASRLVFTEIFEPFPDAESVCTVELSEEKGKTRFTITALYPSEDIRDMVLKSGMEKGAALSYDALERVAMELATR